MVSAALLAGCLGSVQGENPYEGKPLMSLVNAGRVTDDEVLIMIDNGADLKTEAPGDSPSP